MLIEDMMSKLLLILFLHKLTQGDYHFYFRQIKLLFPKKLGSKAKS